MAASEALYGTLTDPPVSEVVLIDKGLLTVMDLLAIVDRGRGSLRIGDLHLEGGGSQRGGGSADDAGGADVQSRQARCRKLGPT